MDQAGHPRAPYAVPRYRAGAEPAWYHVLHGTVPGHQIDFIYCPEVPQGALTQTHLAHVSRLIKYIEPREQTSFAFAIGNLSRDDIQYEPGHGGLALIFGLRVAGVLDHASRAMPPYAHGLLAVDRSLDYGVLLDAIFAFYRRFFEDGPTDAAGSFYRSYVHTMETDPGAVELFLRDYTDGFTELPRSRRSQLGCDYFATDETKLHRITIVHADSEPFGGVAEIAATLGSILYRSDLKWTSISNGREVDIPGGVSVRLVPEHDAPRDRKGPVFRLEELPKDEVELAALLFAARPKSAEAAPRMGWREQAAAKRGGVGGEGGGGGAGVRAKQITLSPGKNALMAMAPVAGGAAGGGVGSAAAVGESVSRGRVGTVPPGHGGAMLSAAAAAAVAQGGPSASPGTAPLKQSSPRLRETAASVGVVAASTAGVPVPPHPGVPVSPQAGVPAGPLAGAMSPPQFGLPMGGSMTEPLAARSVVHESPAPGARPVVHESPAPAAPVVEIEPPTRIATEPMPGRGRVADPVPSATPREPVAVAAAALASALEAEEPEIDDAAPTQSAGFEVDTSEMAAEDEATTLNAGLESAPVATTLDAGLESEPVVPTLDAGLESEPVVPTLVDNPPPPPAPAASAPEPPKPSKAAPPSDPGRVGAGPPQAPPPQTLSPVTDARASLPDDVASLDALPSMKPGKGRWLVLGGVIAALVIGIVVIGSQSGPDESGTTAGSNGATATNPGATVPQAPSSVPPAGGNAPPADSTASGAVTPSGAGSGSSSSGKTSATDKPWKPPSAPSASSADPSSSSSKSTTGKQGGSGASSPSTPGTKTKKPPSVLDREQL